MAESSEIIGKGISWPMRVDHTGSIAMSTGPDDIDRSIRMILSTAPGERLMRPEFGCRIWDQLFEPVNPNTLGRMAQAVREAVRQWEPRAELEDVVVTPDENDSSHVHIRISYILNTTNDRRNLVYPFYMIPHEGEESPR
jgi:phage baseplate assembly protein W